MKKLFFLSILLLSFLAVGCNETKNDKTATEVSEKVEPTTEKDTKQEKPVLSNDWTTEIALNNGSKWEANTETTEGVENMIGLLQNTDPKTTVEFQKLGYKLNDEKNELVIKCTMEGASHDNLHIFLHPLIEKIDYLTKVPSITDGVEVVESINKNLEEYSVYFQ